MAKYHWVTGYFRKDGTYVKGHYQTDPNETKSDNWSTIGNVNPFTGQPGTIPDGTNTTVTTGTTTTVTTSTVTTTQTALTNPAIDYSQRIAKSSVDTLAAWKNPFYIRLGDSKSLYYENEGSIQFSYDLYHSFVIADLRNDAKYHFALSGSKAYSSVWLFDGAFYQLNPDGAGSTDVTFSPAVSGQYVVWIYDDSATHQVNLSITEDIGKDGRNSITNPPRLHIDHTVSKTDPMVDETFYRAANPDVAAAGIDPALHYQQFGWKEGRDPNPWFDTGFYLEQYADVKASGMNPAEHYEKFGWKERRDPSSTFSTSEYLNHNADVLRAGVNPLVQFVKYGYNEDRPFFASALAASL